MTIKPASAPDHKVLVSTLESAAWPTRVSNALPPDRLSSQAYQTVTPAVPSSSTGRRLKGAIINGACHPVTSTAMMAVAANGDRVACSPGWAKPRQPGSSPSGPPSGFTMDIANASGTPYQGCIWSSAGAGAPSVTVSALGARDCTQGDGDRGEAPVPAHAPVQDAAGQSTQPRPAVRHRDHHQHGQEG